MNNTKKQALLGLLRGLGYVVLFGVLDYISKNIGASGLLSASASTIVTGAIASLEHYLTALPTTQLISTTTVQTATAPITSTNDVTTPIM